jgi:signal peptidase I
LRVILRFLRDAVVILLAALVVSFIIKTFLIRSFFIPTESMEATLIRDDRIIVSQLTPQVFELHRGDVIVFVDPGGWLSAQTGVSEDDPLSRILNGVSVFIGLSGADDNKHLVKNLPEGVSKVSSNDFAVTVPNEALWVMGDNRYNSADSRRNMDKPGGGFVPVDNVVGRAIVISWPRDRWEWLSNYPTVFSGIESRLP